MSLPAVKSITDCIDFEKTVLSYTEQFNGLPQLIFESSSSLQALKEAYLSTNPLIFAFAFSLSLFPIFLLISELNKNYSQVDRVWSILPTVYNAHFALFAHATGLPTQRLDTLLGLSILWSIRLTYNYWRKGGYTVGSEDYRWEVLKKYINPPLFFIFNVIFISLAQSLLLFSITTPTYLMVLTAKRGHDSSPIADTVFPIILGLSVFLAFYADQQQWDYQKVKHKYQESAKLPAGYQQTDLDRGFNVSGLFSWSRHPNFAAEQSFWVFSYVWASYVTQAYFNWTIIGPILYLLLFQASTWFTELISATKYPEYREYQRRVGMFLPKIKMRKTGPGDFSDRRGPKGAAAEE